MSHECVYLIECCQDSEDIYKIGFSKKSSIDRRLQNLKTGNPSPLKVLYTFQTKHGRTLETVLHRIYNHKKVRGEWFKLEQYDIHEFIHNCEKLERNFDILVQNNINF